MEWLKADPRHGAALARHAATLQRMMRLYEWQPAHTPEPNADLLAPPPAFSRRWRWWGLAAAGIAVGAAVLWVSPQAEAPRESLAADPVYLRVNERLALPDGSRVELKDGSRVRVRYSENERRVVLEQGEAHFSVWRDAGRPFVVEVEGMSVVAVGTAFNVRREEAAVEVLVTSGRVRLEPLDAPVTGTPLREIVAGERAVVDQRLEGGRSILQPEVSTVSSDDIARALAWQTPRLQFFETRLQDAVEQFNRLNRHQLVLGDPALGELRIGGTFRPDNVDAFVRLLEITLGIKGEKRGSHETVLRRER